MRQWKIKNKCEIANVSEWFKESDLSSVPRFGVQSSNLCVRNIFFKFLMSGYGYEFIFFILIKKACPT